MAGRKTKTLQDVTVDDICPANPDKENKPYFLNFIEEFWDGQKSGSTMGRIEVSVPGEPYDREEIRTDTMDRAAYERLRGKWDWKDVDEKELEQVREEAKKL